MAVDRIGDGFALRSKGDIVSYDGTSAYVLQSSSSGQVLQASSTSPAGAVWATANTAPIEAWVPIAVAQATASTTSLTISNIPSGYDRLVGVLSLRDTVSTTYYNLNPQIIINGNTASSAYTSTYMRWISNNGSLDYENTQTSSGNGFVLNYGSSASTFGTYFANSIIEFPRYAESNMNKPFSYIVSSWASTGIVYSNLEKGYGTTTTTSAITEIQILPHPGISTHFATGSCFDLYGIKES
jgi:hypothetical protein